MFECLLVRFLLRLSVWLLFVWFVVCLLSVCLIVCVCVAVYVCVIWLTVCISVCPTCQFACLPVCWADGISLCLSALCLPVSLLRPLYLPPCQCIFLPFFLFLMFLLLFSVSLFVILSFAAYFDLFCSLLRVPISL